MKETKRRGRVPVKMAVGGVRKGALEEIAGRRGEEEDRWVLEGSNGRS